MQFTITATNAAGSNSAVLNLTTCAPLSSTWVEVASTSTIDVKALYPTAKSFDFIVVGGGGGGVGGFVRAVTTNSMFAQAGGSGGGVSQSNVLASAITGPLTFTIGAGGEGGAGRTPTTTSAYYMGYKGKDGGDSVVSLGATALVTAPGGKGISNQSNNSLWPGGGIGSTFTGGQAPNLTSPNSTTTVGVNSAVEASTGYGSSAYKIITDIPAWATTASGPGAGGTSGGFGNTATSARNSQNGQATTGSSTVGQAGAKSTVVGTDGGAGTNGSDFTFDPVTGVINFGTGGGAGGSNSAAGGKGGNGGNGGRGGAGGGAGGNGTFATSLAGQQSSGNGGRGGDGVILYRPVY